MEKSYRYHVNAQFHQRDRSLVEVEHGAPRTIQFAAPPEFGGQGGMWTPEDFLLAGVASCFVETFKGVAKASKLEFQGVEVAVNGLIEKESGTLRFTRVTISPKLIVFRQADQETGMRLLAKAEHVCLIARSLQSDITFEPKVLVEEMVPV